MANLVLHLRRQRELALERGRTEDPLALGQHAHQLRVPVHLDELDQARPVLVGHPVVRLDLAAGLDVLEQLLFCLGLVHGVSDRPIGRLPTDHGDATA